MIKRFTLGLLLAGQLLLSGCISQYSISEQELSEKLAEKTTEIVKGDGLFKTIITFQESQIQLGQSPNTIDLQTIAKVKIENPLFPIQARLNLALAAQPYYDATDHSIYLQNIEIKQAQAQPKDLDQIVQGLLPSLQPLLSQYFMAHPIYQLDMDDSKQALLAEMTTGIEVKPGEIVLLFK